MFDIICFSVNNWEKRKARKQQFMLHLSKKEDIGNILYVEPPLSLFRLLILPFSELKTSENRNRWTRALKGRIELLSNKLMVYTPIFFIPFSFRIHFLYNVNFFLSVLILKIKIDRIGFKNIILWLYHPFDFLLLKWFKNRRLSIFDWAEEWAEYFVEFNEKKRREIRILEENIVKNVDIVFVVSKKLLEIARKINKNSFHLLDGTIYEVFLKSKEKRAKEIEYIKKPILGYLGTLDDRIDIELLALISRTFSEASLVLIGDIHHQRVDVSSLKNCSNIYLLGCKKYEELGNYTVYFDVCILPYKPELSIFISPTKIYDYLATGRPIVSTNLDEVSKFRDYAYIAESKGEFVEFIKIALSENNEEFSKNRQEIAKANTWNQRASQIIEIIEKVIAK